MYSRENINSCEENSKVKTLKLPSMPFLKLQHYLGNEYKYRLANGLKTRVNSSRKVSFPFFTAEMLVFFRVISEKRKRFKIQGFGSFPLPFTNERTRSAFTASRWPNYFFIQRVNAGR